MQNTPASPAKRFYGLGAIVKGIEDRTRCNLWISPLHIATDEGVFDLTVDLADQDAVDPALTAVGFSREHEGSVRTVGVIYLSEERIDARNASAPRPFIAKQNPLVYYPDTGERYHGFRARLVDSPGAVQIELLDVARRIDGPLCTPDADERLSDPRFLSSGRRGSMLTSRTSGMLYLSLDYMRLYGVDPKNPLASGYARMKELMGNEWENLLVC